MRHCRYRACSAKAGSVGWLTAARRALYSSTQQQYPTGFRRKALQNRRVNCRAANPQMLYLKRLSGQAPLAHAFTATLSGYA